MSWELVRKDAKTQIAEKSSKEPKAVIKDYSNVGARNPNRIELVINKFILDWLGQPEIVDIYVNKDDEKIAIIPSKREHEYSRRITRGTVNYNVLVVTAIKYDIESFSNFKGYPIDLKLDKDTPELDGIKAAIFTL